MSRSVSCRRIRGPVGTVLAVLIGAAAVAGCATGIGSPGTPTPPPTTADATSTTVETTVWVPPLAPTTAASSTTERTTAQRVAPTPAAPPAEKHTTGGSGGGSCSAGEYRNVDGNCVERPTKAAAPPAGATARCNDGTYSFSQNRRGTCSYHGGVAEWL